MRFGVKPGFWIEEFVVCAVPDVFGLEVDGFLF